MSPLDRLAWLAAVASNKELPPMCVSVAIALVQYVNTQTGDCRPANLTIANMIHANERSVRRAIRSLEESGLLVVSNSAGRACLYRPITPRTSTSTPDTQTPGQPVHPGHLDPGSFRPPRTSASTNPGHLEHVPRTFEAQTPDTQTPRTGEQGLNRGREQVNTRVPTRSYDGDLFPPGPPRNDPIIGKIDDEGRWRMEVQNEVWAQEIKKVTSKIGPKNWTQWKTIHDGLFKGDTKKLTEFINGMSADKRWPDDIQTEYSKRRPDAVAELQGRKVHIL